MIYFIVDRENDLCKIGLSDSVESRFYQLQSSNAFELELVKTVEGDSNSESFYHFKFRDFNVRGEWFRYSKVVELENDCFHFYEKDEEFGIRVMSETKDRYYNVTYFRVYNNEYSTSFADFIKRSDMKQLVEDVKKEGFEPFYTNTNRWVHPVLFYEYIRFLAKDPGKKINVYKFITKNINRDLKTFINNNK